MKRILNFTILLIILAGLLALSCAPGAAPPAQPASSPAAPRSALPEKTTEPAKWETVLANARKEGTVSVYTSVAGPSIREALLPVLQNKFGITMELVVGKSDEVTQKIMTERQRGLYLADAHIAGTQMVTTYKSPSSVLSPLEDALLLPEVSDPNAWTDGKLPFLDKDKQTLALTGAYWSYILVNTDLVKEGEIKSYRDLALPKWRGKMIMFDPSIGGAGVYWVMFVRKVMGAEEGDKFLRQLTTLDLIVTRDARLQGEWVARGKNSVAIGPSMGVVTPLLKAGAPISWIRVEEGGLIHPSGSVFGLADKAPHPNAAKVLFNWLLTTEGQRIFSQAFGQPAMRSGVPAEGIDPFTIPRPGEKVFLIDENLIIETETKGRETGREIFGHLLK